MVIAVVKIKCDFRQQNKPGVSQLQESEVCRNLSFIVSLLKVAVDTEVFCSVKMCFCNFLCVYIMRTICFSKKYNSHELVSLQEWIHT